MSNVRNLNDVHIVLVNVDTCEGEPRKALEAIESVGFSSMEDVLDTLHKDNSINYESIFIFSLQEFMTDYNDDVIDVDNSFMGYVTISK